MVRDVHHYRPNSYSASLLLDRSINIKSIQARPNWSWRSPTPSEIFVSYLPSDPSSVRMHSIYCILFLPLCYRSILDFSPLLIPHYCNLVPLTQLDLKSELSRYGTCYKPLAQIQAQRKN
jgi:hypothetical protein